MEALGSLFADFRGVKTAKQLRQTLTRAVVLMEKDMPELACDWERRLEAVPQKMDKEAINYVLLSAAWQLEQGGE